MTRRHSWERICTDISARIVMVAALLTSVVVMSESTQTKPAFAAALPGVVDVSVSQSACALTQAGEVYCWGATPT